MTVIHSAKVLAKILATTSLWIFVLHQLPGAYHEEDTGRNIFELITSRGFTYERHYVTTQDGYILQMIRLVNPYTLVEKNLLRPVLLHHGFQCSGSMWLVARDGFLDQDGHYYELDFEQRRRVNGSEEVANTLAFVLASQNYDVWLANYRGSIYSTNHTRLDTKSKEFWSFSMDEMIHQDLPHQISYILAETNRTDLAYVGHSQGNLMMLALMSVSDHYAQRIKPFIALSPVFYHMKTPSALVYFAPFRQRMIVRPSFVPFDQDIRLLIAHFCENIYTRELCYYAIYPFLGWQSHHLIQERIPVYMNAIMMGSSSWNAAHLLQMAINFIPEHFDYGRQKNLKIYGNMSPPVYNASHINSTEIALIYAQNDWLNHLDSVNELKANLRVPLLDDYQIPDETYNHMDLVWAKSVGSMVNARILQLLAGTGSDRNSNSDQM